MMKINAAFLVIEMASLVRVHNTEGHDSLKIYLCMDLFIIVADMDPGLMVEAYNRLD